MAKSTFLENILKPITSKLSQYIFLKGSVLENLSHSTVLLFGIRWQETVKLAPDDCLLLEVAQFCITG